MSEKTIIEVLEKIVAEMASACMSPPQYATGETIKNWQAAIEGIVPRLRSGD